MRHHHPAFGQADAYLFHVQQVREDEVHAGVRERWITHRRTDALKGLDVELLNGEPLIRSISPIAGSNLLVHLLGSGLGKPVGQRLCHHLPVRVGGGKVFFQCRIDGSGKHPHFIGNALGERTDEIGQAETGLIRA